MTENGARPEAPPSELPRRRRRWPWITLAAILALGLGLRALLPFAAERGVAWASRRYLGLPARVDNVDFSFLGGGIAIDGLTVGPYPDTVTPLQAAWRPPVVNPRNALLHWKRVAVRFSWRALLHHTLHLTEVTVETPQTRVMRETDGRIDPLRHAHPEVPRRRERAGGEAAASPASPPPKPWKIQIDRFSLSHPEVRVVDAATSTDLVRFSLDDFGLQRVSVEGRDLALGGVTIRGPVLRVRRDLLFAQGQRPQTATPRPRPSTGAASPAGTAASRAAPAYRIGRIDIERAQFVWITDAGPVPVALTLHASNVTAQPGERFPVDLALEVQNGRIGIRGQAGMVPPAYVGSLSWTHLPFPPLALAATPQLSRWLRACSSSGDLELDLDLGAKDRPDLTLSGRTAVDGLWIVDPEGMEVSLKWKRLELGIRRIAVTLAGDGGRPATTRVSLDRVALVDPEVLYTRPSPALEKILAGEKKSGAGSPTPAAERTAAPSPPAAGAHGSEPLEISLAAFKMSGANVELLDKTVKPQTRTRIRGLSVSARDLRYPAVAAQRIQVRATLPQGAPLALDGGLQPRRAEFQLSLKRLDLQAFNAYASAAGARLDHGQASLETKVRLRGERIQAENHLLLSKLGLSLEDPASFQERFGVPIDLALALLRDPAGDIRLSIPMSVKAQQARVGLTSVVASALRQALVGALSAPLKMAGAAFSGLKGAAEGGGGISIEPIPAVPGSAAVSEDASARIDGLAQLLSSRRELGLVLRGRSGPADRPGVAEQILIERAKAGEGLPDVRGAGFFARRRLRQALERRAQGEPTGLSAEDQALYDRMIAAVAVPEGRLHALARQRADALRALLVARPEVEARRVTVGEPASDGAPAVLVGFKAQ